MSSLAGPLLLVAGLVLVVAGARVFFDGLVATASRFGIAPFFLTVVVSGLELENLAAGIAANAKGLGNAAAGTFLGGTTFLALGVAGLAAVIAPVRAELPLPVLLWSTAAPLPLFALGLDGRLSRLDGGILVAWFTVALVGLARSGGRETLQESAVGPARRRPLALLLAGLGVMTGAGLLLGEGIQRVVARFDVSQSLLGNTAIAAAVEAEEVARVAVSSRRGRGDLALGNILGTIVHFAALNAGVIALVRPISLDHDTQNLHLPMAAAAPFLLTALVFWRGKLARNDGFVLLALYGAYVIAAVSA